jgi:hypothetical protein
MTLAAPVWRGATVTGALALLVPDTQMRYAYCRKRHIDILTKAATTLSHHTTRNASPAPAAAAAAAAGGLHAAVCGRGTRFERASA